MTREAISEQLVLRGKSGLVDGENFSVDYGETVIIGRSSSCDISLKKCEKYLLLPDVEKESEKHFQTVSRKHCRISFYNATTIEIEDLSSNGTFLDGEQIQKVIISDLQKKPHELLLGTKEMFVLEYASGAPAPVVAGKVQGEIPSPEPMMEEDEEDDPTEVEATSGEKDPADAVVPAQAAGEEDEEEVAPALAVDDDEDEDGEEASKEEE